jgi:hypothetical protein
MKLVSGGYYVTGLPADMTYNSYTFAPEESASLDFYDSNRIEMASRQAQYPIDLTNRQGWYIWTGSAQNGCWKAVAICTN